MDLPRGTLHILAINHGDLEVVICFLACEIGSRATRVTNSQTLTAVVSKDTATCFKPCITLCHATPVDRCMSRASRLSPKRVAGFLPRRAPDALTSSLRCRINRFATEVFAR